MNYGANLSTAVIKVLIGKIGDFMHIFSDYPIKKWDIGKILLPPR